MASGNLDKELARISAIANAITPNTLLLNESLASTNELEGARTARQIFAALHECGIRLCFVARLYAFAHGLFEDEARRVRCSGVQRRARTARGCFGWCKASRWRRVTGWICSERKVFGGGAAMPEPGDTSSDAYLTAS